MKDIVNEYMKNNQATNWFGVKRLHCNDGFSMSVQAHDGAYCSPRVDPTDTDYYFEVEVGFPSDREELLMEYVEDYDNPTRTVYAYVPVEVVQEVIEKHGGIKGMKENNEGDNTARGPSASGADLSVGAVLSVLKDTKELNESSRNTRERLAGIAFLALQSLDDRDGVSDKYIPAITALAERAVVTPLHNAGPTDDEIIHQCIITIEEYLKEQGV